MDKMMNGKAKEAKEMHNSRGKEVAERYMNQEKKKKEGGSAVVGGWVVAPRNKPMPKAEAKSDPVERLLQERELDYQGAMGIADNDLRTREAELLQIQKAYAESGVKIEGFEEFLANKHAEIKRAYRDVVSEQSYLFENDLRNYAIGSGELGDVNKTEAKQRQVSQPIPGTQAHHPASVSSVESYLRNMSMEEQRKALDMLVEQGYVVGSQAKGFIPLSGPAHLGGGERWGRNFAHVGKEGVESDPGRFKGTALPKGATAEQAVAAMKPMLDEQRVLNEAAYSHPVEQQMRAAAERLLGKPITWMGGETPDVQAQNKEAKALGFNATTVSKGFSRYPALMESDQVPGVDIMTDVGSRIPLGTKPSEDVRRQAYVAVTSQSLGQKAAAIATREPIPVPRPQPAVGQAAILNGKPVVWNGSDWVKAPRPVVKPVVKPAVKPAAKPKVKPKATVKPKPVVPATSTTRTIPTSASMQIRALQNAASDVIKIHPGMSLPSSSLIQGI